MVLGDIVGVALRPRRGFAALAPAASVQLASAVVAGAGLAALGLSVASTLVEPGSEGRAAGIGVSLTLPVLFAAFWLIDALIVDAVAQLMGAPTRLHRWLAASAHIIPVLLLYEVVRLLQAAVDRAGSVDAGTALGFLDFGVLAWFIGLVTVGVGSVYELPGLSAFAAALAPAAAMAAVVVALVVIFSGLSAAGIG